MATQKELGVHEAYIDDDCWILYSKYDPKDPDINQDDYMIEEWPSDWPEKVTDRFLKERGVITLP